MTQATPEGRFQELKRVALVYAQAMGVGYTSNMAFRAAAEFLLEAQLHCSHEFHYGHTGGVCTHCGIKEVDANAKGQV